MISSSQTSEASSLLPQEIRLQTHSEDKMLNLNAVSQDQDEHYTYILFEVFVSGPLIHANERFVVSTEELNEFTAYLLESSESTINDENGRGSITVSRKDSLGHFRVEVQVGGIEEDQARVSFDTDQTAISTLQKDLQQLTKNVT
jgi:predicted aspartyl protease